MYHPSVQTATAEACIAAAGARIIDIIDVLAETDSRGCSAGGAKPQSIQPHTPDRRRALFPFYFGPVILFDWPDTPKKRAEGRYFEAEANARKEADIQLIQFIADRLGMPNERVAEAYPDAERTVARRMERSDRYRRRNAELKRWLSRS